MCRMNPYDSTCFYCKKTKEGRLLEMTTVGEFEMNSVLDFVGFLDMQKFDAAMTFHFKGFASLPGLLQRRWSLIGDEPPNAPPLPLGKHNSPTWSEVS